MIDFGTAYRIKSGITLLGSAVGSGIWSLT